jgi:hypothetical protein
MENTINAEIATLRNKSIPKLQKEFEALLDGQRRNIPY